MLLIELYLLVNLKGKLKLCCLYYNSQYAWTQDESYIVIYLTKPKKNHYI